MAIKRKPIYVLILPRFEDIFHSYYTGEITKGVNLAASRLNVDYLVHITDRSNHNTWLDPTLLDRKYVDGILFADIDNDLDIVKKAIMRGMPCLVLNNVIQEPINYIAVNIMRRRTRWSKNLLNKDISILPPLPGIFLHRRVSRACKVIMMP